MLFLKKNKKKIIRYTILLVFLFGIIGFLIYKNFLSKPKNVSAPLPIVPDQISVDKNEKSLEIDSKIKTKEKKEIINLDLLENSKFIKLKDHKVQYQDFPAGNSNPFTFPEKGILDLVATSTAVED